MKNREKVMAMLINVSDNKDVGVFNQVKINAEINEIYMGGDVTKKYTPLHGVSIFDNKIQEGTGNNYSMPLHSSQSHLQFYPPGHHPNAELQVHLIFQIAMH